MAKVVWVHIWPVTAPAQLREWVLDASAACRETRRRADFLRLQKSCVETRRHSRHCLKTEIHAGRHEGYFGPRRHAAGACVPPCRARARRITSGRGVWILSAQLSTPVTPCLGKGSISRVK